MDKLAYFSPAESRTKSDPDTSLALHLFLYGNSSTPAVEIDNLNPLNALHQRLGFSLPQFLKDHEVPGSDKSTPTYNFPILDPYLEGEKEGDFRSPAEFLTDHEVDDEASAAKTHSILKNHRPGKQRFSRHNLRYQHLRGRNAPQNAGSEMGNEVNLNFELTFNLKSSKSQLVTAKDAQSRTSKLVPQSSSHPARLIVISTSGEEEDSESNSALDECSDRDSEYETEAMMDSQDEISWETESSSSDSVSKTSNKENWQPDFGTPDIFDSSSSWTNSPTEYVSSDLSTGQSRKPAILGRYGALAKARGHSDSRTSSARYPRTRIPGKLAPAASSTGQISNYGPKGEKIINWLQLGPSAPQNEVEKKDCILSGSEEKKVMLDKSALAKSGRRLIPLERMRVKKAKNLNRVENSHAPERAGEESSNFNHFAGIWSGNRGQGSNFQGLER
jgi:hypothetical protein